MRFFHACTAPGMKFLVDDRITITIEPQSQVRCGESEGLAMEPSGSDGTCYNVAQLHAWLPGRRTCGPVPADILRRHRLPVESK